MILQTRWRLSAIAGNAWRNDDLDLTLTVDTTAPVVVNAIERAAERHGVELERIYQGGVCDEPEPDEEGGGDHADDGPDETGPRGSA